MEKSNFWKSYLAPSLDPRDICNHMQDCSRTLSGPREMLGKLIQSYQPHSFAGLGSGFLNDIPVEALFSASNQIYFVEWIENITELGMLKSIISRSHGAYRCLFCHENIGDKFCINFSGKLLDNGLCSRFEAMETPFLTCKNYKASEQPKYIKGDITAGIAKNFAAKIEKQMNHWRTPKDAFIKAEKLLYSNGCDPLPIDDASIDLVTSSMVLSQFDVEPYAYFACLLEKKFSHDTLSRQKDKLEPYFERFRTKLFTAQVEAHCKEMHRIVKKNGTGRIFLSTEMYRSHSDSTKYFVVQDMPKALDIIGRYFDFEFGKITEDRLLQKINIGNGTSIIQSSVLLPK